MPDNEENFDENEKLVNAFLSELGKSVLTSMERMEGLTSSQVSFACLLLAADVCASEIAAPLPFMYATDRRKVDQYLRQVSSDTVKTFKGLLDHKIATEVADARQRVAGATL